LTSALDGGEWSASHPSCFTLRERALGTHWIGGWVDPQFILDVVVKRKFSIPTKNRTLDPAQHRKKMIKPQTNTFTKYCEERGKVKVVVSLAVV
jgi:hypothetical protein